MTVSQTCVDPNPGFARSLDNGAGLLARPVARLLPVGKYPATDLLDGQRGKSLGVANAATSGEEFRERIAALQSAEASIEILVDFRPVLLGGFGNGAAEHMRPLPGPLVMGVGPAKNKRDVQRRLSSRSAAPPVARSFVPGSSHSGCS